MQGSRLRPLRHLRQNFIAYLALFFALSGSATAAGVLLRAGDPAGGDLAGTYPNPTLRSGAIYFSDGVVTGVNLGPLAPGGCVGGFGRTIPGLQPNDIPIVRAIQPYPFHLPPGIVVSGRVEDDAVTIYVCNVSTDTYNDLPTTSYRIIVLR